MRLPQHISVRLVLPLVGVQVSRESLPQLADERGERGNGVAVGDADQRRHELVPQIPVDEPAQSARPDAQGREQSSPQRLTLPTRIFSLRGDGWTRMREEGGGGGEDAKMGTRKGRDALRLIAIGFLVTTRNTFCELKLNKM